MGTTVGGRLAAGERPLTARYALDEVLARGGVGEVWRARDLRLGRPVAVKVLHGAQADPHFRTRFRNEAQHAARLSHPNIAAVFDYGEEAAEDGDEPTPFLVMELVEGESLADLLARRGRLGVGRTLSILRQLSSGLAAAHEAGVVHRDVKPANVLVRPDGIVKITDFGIAASAASAALTETGQVVGTARYLSPEQARGKRGTPASDVYALGLVGYECLAGRPAFDGPDPVQVAAKQVSEPPPPLPPDVPEQVCGLVRTATAKDPARRLPDGAALRDALDRLLENGRRAARSTVPPRPGPVAGATALSLGPLDETTVETSGPVPIPVPMPAGARGAPTAAKNADPRRRWWPVAVGTVLLCALATVLLVVGRSGAAGSPGTVRAGLEARTARSSPTSHRARLPGGATLSGPATVAPPGAQAGAVAVGGPTAAAPTAGGPTAGGGVHGTTRGDGAPHAGTAATGGGAGTGASTGTTGAATGGAAPTAGGPSAAGGSSAAGAPQGGSGSTAGPAGAATDTGSPSAGSTPSDTGASVGSTGTSTGASGSTSGSTAGPTDGGATGTSGTEPAAGGTPGAGTGTSGTDTSGTGTSGTGTSGTSGADTSGTGASSTGASGTGSAGTPTPGA